MPGGSIGVVNSQSRFSLGHSPFIPGLKRSKRQAAYDLAVIAKDIQTTKKKARVFQDRSRSMMLPHGEGGPANSLNFKSVDGASSFKDRHEYERGPGRFQ